MPEQLTMFPEDQEAKNQAFVDKFKQKKTTDDCITPANVYAVVAQWVAQTYAIDPASFVRPFWPGGDYERFDYPEGCAVVDNPPFSILARIREFYVRRGIRFFLFAPTLTLFSGNRADVTYIPCGVQVTYANGAKVNSSFVTNLDSCLVRTAPDLYRRVKAANAANEQAMTKTLPKYSYPVHVLTAATAYQFSHYGIDYRLEREDATFIRKLDAMTARGKDSGIFGGAFLLSERAAAEKAAAEKAAATVWQLSERELAIVRSMRHKASPPAIPHSEFRIPHSPISPDPFDLSALMSMPKEAPDHA